ncbi:MAG TPA: YceI family protein [Acidimicrobiia bacterium]|nr:YceI family protein [Acidimicrobiia bacterium]
MNPKPRRRWLIALPLVLIVLGGAGLIWFFGRDVPEEASIDAATSLTTSTADNVTAGGSETTGSSASLTAFIPDGEWVIDTSIGDFSFTEATASFAGFRVNEELSGIGATTAIGRTPELEGRLDIEDGIVTAGSVEADLTAIVSNESRRDDRIQSALNTSSNPIASFVLNEEIELPSGLVEGSTFTVEAVGDLTVNGITNPVVIPLEGAIANGGVLLAGGVEIVFAEYDVVVPRAPVVLSAEDHGILEVQLWFTRA